MGDAKDTQFRVGRKDITMLEDSQHLPARPSDGSTLTITMLIFVKICDFK
jgi:hypothetical protein